MVPDIRSVDRLLGIATCSEAQLFQDEEGGTSPSKEGDQHHS